MASVSSAAPTEMNRPLGDAVYRRLRDALQSGQIPGGTELREIALANQYQVSRTPVRQALQRLAVEGLVENHPNRGSIVINFGKREILEIYKVRELLEAGAVTLAAQRIDDRQLAELRELAVKLPTASEEAVAAKEDMEHDERFHQIIAEASGNECLKGAILCYTHKARLIRWLAWRNADRRRLFHHDHLAIVEALENRDADAARAAMVLHYRLATHMILKARYGDEDTDERKELGQQLNLVGCSIARANPR